MDTDSKEEIKIRLTGRAPVRIDREAWPIVAYADWFSGQHECQANEVAYLKVRRHADGRTIVYGRIDSGPGGMPIGYEGKYCGYVTDVAGTAAKIAECGAILGIDYLTDACMANLPAENI